MQAGYNKRVLMQLQPVINIPAFIVLDMDVHVIEVGFGKLF